MYFPYFIAYMVTGIVIGVVVFLWALGTGQFKEQTRARFLPLRDVPPGWAPRASRVNRLEGMVLMGLALIGVLTMGAVLFFTFFKW